MALDPAAVGSRGEPRRVSWTPRDCALYALGVGATDLQFVTENTAGVPMRTLPTMPVVLGFDMLLLERCGPIDWTRVLHLSHSVRSHAPLPVQGVATTRARIAHMWDKGRAAVVAIDTEALDAAGRPLFDIRSTWFVGGGGGWGGERGPAVVSQRPDGPPAETVVYPTRPDQALLYRLSGDVNPIHSDPAVARAAGFDRPILHGLCTFGFAGRALLRLLDGDPAGVGEISANFRAPVFPGQRLHVDLWRAKDGARFAVRTTEGPTVLGEGRMLLRQTPPAPPSD
ncbi:MAG: MaoC/PaaZ C-terminal domain-containing protein [Sporichthyaceae bacterium]